MIQVMPGRALATSPACRQPTALGQGQPALGPRLLVSRRPALTLLTSWGRVLGKILGMGKMATVSFLSRASQVRYFCIAVDTASPTLVWVGCTQ